MLALFQLFAIFELFF